MKMYYVLCVYATSSACVIAFTRVQKETPVFSSSTCSFFLIFRSLVLFSFSRASHCIKKGSVLLVSTVGVLTKTQSELSLWLRLKATV